MRETGYYWVRIGLSWYIAKYNNKTTVWLVCKENNNVIYHELDLLEIDEKQIKRE